MMKNKIFKLSLLILNASFANAGDMGDTTNKYPTTPFIIGEANFSYIAYQTEVFNNLYSTQINNIWGGRFGAGLTRKYRGNFSLSGELGYGYYGRVRSSFINNVNNNHYAIDGLDTLVGVIYKLKDLDLFFKAGAMIENKRIKGTLDIGKTYNNDTFSGQKNYNSNFTQVLPALKTGGMYNLSPNIALSLSYMHVFGSSTSSLANYSSSSSPLTVNTYSSIHDQNPSLDSVLFGIQYNLT